MAIKLSSNPTCVLSDADNLSAEQRQKINMNLTKGIPGSDIEGDKVTVINSEGEVEMKAYSAGGGTSYTAGDGIDITSDTISTKIDGSTITLNSAGELQAAGGGSETPCIVDWDTLTAEEIFSVVRTAIAANQPVFAKYSSHTTFDTYYYPLNTWHDNNGYITLIFLGFSQIYGTRSGGAGSAQGYRLYAGREGEAATPEKVTREISCCFVPFPPEYADDGTTLQIQDGSMTWVAPN